MIIGALTFQMPLARITVAVLVDGRQRVRDGGAGVLVLFADVARHGGVVAVRIRVSGLDPVYVALDQGADHAGEHLRVADLEVGAATVVVVLARPGEVSEQNAPAVRAGAGGAGGGDGVW
jgi:hypothetical protein